MVSLVEDRQCRRALGRFAAKYVADGCPIPEEPKKNRFSQAENEQPSHPNEPWRRVTGITGPIEEHMDRRERRAGIARLFAEIEARYLDKRGGLEGEAEAVESADGYPLTPRANGCASALSPRGEGLVWASEGQSRSVLMVVCQDYNISAYQLNLLAREYRGVTASELIDGLRTTSLNAALAELLKTYAREFWLIPGDYANVLASEKKLRVYCCDSKYFVDPDADWRRAEMFETRAERRAALIEAFDAGWSRGEQSRDGFAAALGFRSFKELNRACLNVRGKTVRQLAYKIACDIVEFYLAAEIKMLRELACCDSSSHNVMRARYLYCGDCERPVGPFNDFWETNDPAWLGVMEAWFRVD